MELLNNILCLTGQEIMQVIPENTYKSLQHRNKITVHTRGGNGRCAMIEYESLPEQYRQLVIAKWGDPYQYMAKQPIRDLIQPDYKAKDFFETYLTTKGGQLSDKHLIEYPNDAAILNAISVLLADKVKLKRTLNVKIGQFWKAISDLIKELKNDPRYQNSLPTSERHLKPLYASYKAEGYSALISKSYGNDNRTKIDTRFEWLILSLYCRPGCKPYAADVLKDYNDFMAGKLELCDTNTGEMFTRTPWMVDDKPLQVSQSSIWNIINEPSNRATVDAIRNGGLYNSKVNRPIVFRHSPVYAFSKITMDDLQFPFKLKDGYDAIGYQIMDVASGCVIGKAYGKGSKEGSGKDRTLFMEAVKDMFRFVVNGGFGIPGEIEVEHHISNTFRDDILKEGYLFPFVRFCAPGNPREKRAEHIFRGKKYSQQHKREGFHGRFYGKLEANVPNLDKVSRRYEFAEVVANEDADIHAWNHSQHPNQEQYPGMSRWQVLQKMHHPNLTRPNMPVIAKHIGNTTRDAVQIYNNQWFWCSGNKYLIPSDARLMLSSYYIRPYYIPTADGAAPQCYVYQNDKFICAAPLITPFNESQVERTDADEANMKEQLGYISQFDHEVKRRKAALGKLKVLPVFNSPSLVEIREEREAEPALWNKVPQQQFDADYWANKALNDL